MRYVAFAACLVALVLAIKADVPAVAAFIAFAGLALLLSNFESKLHDFTTEVKALNIDVASVNPQAVLELRRANPGMSMSEAIKRLEADKSNA